MAFEEEPLLTAFGAFLRRRRRTTEQTQEMVADKCPSIKRATYARWELGQVPKRLTDEQLTELAGALETDVDLLRFRYERSLDLASQQQEVCGQVDFYKAQIEFDTVIAEQALLPRNETERSLWSSVESALRAYLMVRSA